MNIFRPRLPETKSWQELIDFAREYGAQDVLETFLRSKNNKKESIDISEDGIDYIIRSESERVKTKEDLIEATGIDEQEYDIYRYITNKYDQHSVEKGLVELYQVKAWMKKKYLDKPDPDYYNKWLDALSNVVDVAEIPKKDNSAKPIVLTIADLHTGKFVQADRLHPDYNVEVIRERLDYIARYANAYNRPIYVFMLGDYIESFTGKNHKDTWKQIEMHGMEVALTASDLIIEFLQKLHDVRGVQMIGGNHDRITSANDDDKQGQVAYLIAGIINRYTSIGAEFHPRILTPEVDGIKYILTHGDKRITKKDPAEMILEYGDQNLFNVMLNAHGHEEKIHKNSLKYQARQVPPIVVGGNFSKDIGVSANSGFTLIEASDRAGVILQTVPL